MFESLTDAQWSLVESQFPEPEKRGRGKPHAPWRAVLNSILFILMTGAKWGSLPKMEAFASKSASHRWVLIWNKNGFLEKIIESLKGFSSLSATSLIFPPQRRTKYSLGVIEAPLEEFVSA